MASTLPVFAQDCDALKAQLSTRQGLDTYLHQETGKEVICAIALQTNGQTSTYCYAIFDYRSEQANDAFKQLQSKLSSCFSPLKAQGAGDIVNHPDSFDQKQYCADQNDLSLSLKDKATLNQTLVFLRLDQRGPNEQSCH